MTDMLWFLLVMAIIVGVVLFRHAEKALAGDIKMTRFAIFIFLCGLIIGFIYFEKFDVDLNNTDFKTWVDVAVYFNNAFSPLLLFATVILLYMTWKTSDTELNQTREVLKSQTELLLFDKIAENLRYITGEISTLLHQQDDISRTKASLRKIFDQLGGQKVTAPNSPFIDLNKINTDSLATYCCGETVSRETVVSSLNHENKIENLTSFGKALTYLSKKYELQQIGSPGSERAIKMHLRLGAEKLISLDWLRRKDFMERVDTAMLNFLKYLSHISAPELQKILYLKVREELSNTLGSSELFSLYETRFLDLSEVKNNELLQVSLSSFYSFQAFEKIELNSEIIELA
ncbi:hypothetical protein QDG88_09470 [Pseudoalteromonas piscicida]|uniref:hypothetical protein n=1 Tax=Pseudoalteromonas piscicida TaxID=43662 RepID=UPI00273968D2|nr:hypothetical protein [Pseudoalteromonas piscicida]MDP4488170.1 hypothetical protein [Pseudoalteromonas piscicida]